MWNIETENGPDKVDPSRSKSWNKTNEENGPGIFYFTVAWRKNLSGVSNKRIAMSLYNFKTGNNLLSYKTKFLAATTTYTTVSLEVEN